ncbi:MAG: bifunctional glutamate N-acetyltransferase/amino-acid acetyltransferase ArgJ [Acidimicrobiales bacterium]
MSITRAKGFVASGVHCGIKPEGALDLALVATADGVPVPAAAVFTSNRAAAAPVLVSREHLQATGGHAAAVVLNSGNANAATGATGRAHVEQTCGVTAEGLGCAEQDVLVCSTGLIGIPLPVEALVGGIPALVEGRRGDPQAATRAAEAILTTDTTVKETMVGVGFFTIGGMAKGAAMLAPNLATMLAVLTTDAAATPEQLQVALREAVAGSFNTLSIDGSCSTNDTVIVLASGKAGPVGDEPLLEMLSLACQDLAEQMADDAEGATKVAVVRVQGAASDGEARMAARRIAESQLVQCSLYGADPYWGRIVSEVGASGAVFDLDRVSVAYGGVTVCREGIATAHDDAAVRAHLAGRMVEVTVDLGGGEGTAAMLTTDLSPAYIDENMRTS